MKVFCTHRKRALRYGVGIACAAFLFIAALPIAAGADENDPAYPGRARGGMTVLYAEVYVREGLRAYYKAHGEWPQRWSDLRAAGIIQADLLAPGGQTIDPDDGSLDFRRDVVYDSAATHSAPAGSPALYRVLDLNGDESVHEAAVPPGFREMLFAYHHHPGRPPIEPYLGSAALSQMALASMLDNAMLVFSMVYGCRPASLTEFLESGLSPITKQSVNPLTGATYRFDGSANDLSVQAGRSPDGKNMFRLDPVDSAGAAFRLFSPY